MNIISATTEHSMTKTLKPFLKWAGGKGQLLNEIEKYYPFETGSITKYAEPFVGGGAVLFDILSKYDLDEIYISDTNAELINTYVIVRDHIDELIELLSKYQCEYLPLKNEKRRIYYTEKRNEFNDIKVNGNETENIKKAALMIFLNKTCFNGLYRVNKKGLFNVPMGAYKNPVICDDKNLRTVSEKLQNVKIVCGDYRESAKFIDEHTFVYFDPPYRPLTETSSFTAYTENLFDDKKQIELAQFVEHMNKKSAKIVVSNSDPKNNNNDDIFFDNLYSKYKIKRVEANRMINCNGEARGKVKELLISNFEEGKKMRNFNQWFNTFIDSIATWKYYTDFEKVYKNTDKVKDELNILNGLIGVDNIKSEFIRIANKYPNTLKAVPILIAKREYEIKINDSEKNYLFNFKNPNYSIDEYAKFMEKTGLFEMLQKHLIHSLYDYVMGVEIGMDTNGRKNRTGHAMEDLVESFIQKAGFVKGVNYFKEMYIHQITEKWDIDLSAISNQGKMEKRFDFVIKTDNMIYGIETNFYSSGGSKLNETARSYKTLALETDTIDGFTFVWFTDGKGWTSARNNLEETFDVMEHIYNIKDLEDNIIKTVMK